MVGLVVGLCVVGLADGAEVGWQALEDFACSLREMMFVLGAESSFIRRWLLSWVSL